MILVTGPHEVVRAAVDVAFGESARARGVVCVLLTALACGVSGAAPARAAPAWLEPVDVGSAPVVGAPHIDVDGQGTAVAVFERGDFTDTVVQGAVRPAGGAWQTPVDISAPTGNAFSEQVAVDVHGNALAVWIRRVGTNFVAQAAWRPAGGVWQAPVDISDVGVYVADPQVAIGADGTAVAVWQNVKGIDYMAQGAVRTPGGTWQTPVDLSAAGASTGVPHVAIDAQGDAVAVWERYDGTDYIVQSASRPASGVWQTPVDLSAAGRTTYGSQVAVNAEGNAVAVWHRDGDNGDAIVQSAVRPANGGWQPAVDISAGSQYTQPAQVAIDEQGDAVAIWGHLKGGAAVEVQGAVRPAGGAWQPAVDLSAPGIETYGPELDVDDQGNAVAIWYQNTATNHIYDVLTAMRPAGADWQTPRRLATTDEVAIPQVALGPEGNGVAVWRTFTVTTDPTIGIVKSSGYDPAGPLQRELVVPQSGVVGEPVSFSVSPFDVWSALGATSWSFGDGAAASGSAVTHTYASAGTFSVAVSSADELANHTRTTRTITIAPQPPGPVTPAPPARPGPSVTPPPSVIDLRLSANTFRAARSGPAVTANSKRAGTRVSYRLNVAASVRFTVERCVTLTRNKRCARYTRLRGSVDRSRAAGTDRFRLTGRLAGRTFRPGRYRLIATPTANRRTGTPSRARFRIVS